MGGCFQTLTLIIEDFVASRLATIASRIVSPQQRGFLKDRQIQDSGPKGMRTPSHVLYADDFLIFCKGLKPNLVALNSLIKDYAEASGQHEIVRVNSRWLVGNGTKVNFWRDKWLDDVLVDLFQIPSSLHHVFVSNVADFVMHNCWTIPRLVAVTFPNVVEKIVRIHTSNAHDKLIWQGTMDGVRLRLQLRGG
ncbi:hypothetical protein Lal_00018018 [Lupinus albus]|nr:hypothetical protein Lal_00018018 [Lupinus albus]